MTESISFLLTAGLIGFSLFCAGYIVGVASMVEEEARDER